MVLEGLRVIELAEGFAGPFCGLQFADAGAEVIKVETPEGDKTRKIGPYNNGISSVYLALNRGKKSVVLDYKTNEGRDALLELIRRADVLIVHFQQQGEAESLGLEYDRIREANPRIIYGSISDLGSRGELSGGRGSELVAQAYSGIWRFLGDMTSKEARSGIIEPLRVGYYMGTSWAGTFLFHAALSALLCRSTRGIGQKVETSILGAIVSVQTQNWAVMTKTDRWHGFEIIGPMGIPDNGITTKDGAIQGILGRPGGRAGRRNTSEGVVAVYNLLGINPDDPRLIPAIANGLPRVAADRPGLELINNAFSKYTKQEAMDIMVKNGLGGAPINTYEEFVAHPQTKHMGIVVDIEHPAGGTFKTIHPPWGLMSTPVSPAGRPPLLGQNTEDVLMAAGLDTAQIARIKEAHALKQPLALTPLADPPEPLGISYDGPGPLQGIKVVDFSGAAVGPWSGSVLGMLGAHVIKVDPFPMGDGIVGREPTQNGVPIAYVAFNQGKSQVVGLDLKNEEDKKVALELIKEADVLIENFRPGVMSRLGVGYETASEINPGIIYCSASGYGQTGPISHWGAGDPSIKAFAGAASLDGPPGGRPELNRFYSTHDLGTSVAIAAGALLGLHQRQKTGRGQWMQTSMIEANSYLQTHRYAEFFATGVSPKPMGSSLPNIVPDQAFPTDDGQIAVSATSEKEWESLCTALDLSSLAADPRFATNDDRVRNREELIRLLKDKFKTLPSWWWITQLNKFGVPCGLYLTLENIMTHKHFWDNGFLVDVEIPIAGRLVLAGPPFHFTGTPAKIVRPALPVVPPNRPPMYYPLDQQKYPNGYPGEHTAQVKERFKKGLPLYAM